MKSKLRLAAMATAVLLAWPLAAVGTPGGGLNLTHQNQDLGTPAGSGNIPPIIASGKPLPGIIGNIANLDPAGPGSNGSGSNPTTPPPGNGNGSGTPVPGSPGIETPTVLSLGDSGISGTVTSTTDDESDGTSPSGTSPSGTGPGAGEGSTLPSDTDGTGVGSTGSDDPEPSNSGAVVNYLILELQPDFRLKQSLRLFEAQSTAQGGQDSLGVAPALAATSRRFVPLGEF